MEKFEEAFPKLLQLEIFSDFEMENPEDRRIMAAVWQFIKTQSFKKGQTIIKEGELADDFYILYSGSVRVQQKTLSGDSIALADMNSDMNIFFGEAALIDQDVRSATVVATSDCKCLVLTGDDFKTLCLKESVFGYRVTMRIARRLAASLRKSNRDKSTLYEALLSEVQG